MARGAAQQQNLLNTQAKTSFGNAQNLYSGLTKDYQSILDQPGYTKDQINTQMNAAETPIAGQIASGQQTLKDRSASTGNTAGMVAGQRDLARTGAQLGSQAAWGVQSNADNVALSEHDKALQGMNSLYSPSLSSASSLYSQATNAMEARPSVLQDIGAGVGIFRNLIPAPKSS